MTSQPHDGPVLDVVEQVDSPNEARAYGTGEVIIIDVVFNQEVTLEGQPTLMLETGVFNQEVTCAYLSAECVHPGGKGCSCAFPNSKHE